MNQHNQTVKALKALFKANQEKARIYERTRDHAVLVSFEPYLGKIVKIRGLLQAIEGFDLTEERLTHNYLFLLKAKVTA